MRGQASRDIPAYFALTFAISWGGFLLLVGPGNIPAAPEAFDRLPVAAILVMLVGPSASALLLTGRESGMTGVRHLLGRAAPWRTSVSWGAMALLAAPLIFSAVLLALPSLVPGHEPAIVATDDPIALIVRGATAALVVGILEEIGWTGYALPRLRERHSVLRSGIIVGVLWGAWHLLANDAWASVATAGDVPVGRFVLLRGISLMAGGLVAFRILMTWAHERTDGSLPVAILAHAGYAAATFILNPATLSGRALLAYDFASALALWIVVAMVVTGSRELMCRGPSPGSPEPG